MVLLFLATAPLGCSSNKPVHQWNDRVLETGSVADDGDLTTAREHYERLLETAPGAEERRYVLVELGRLAEEQGEFQDALAYYERVWSEERDDEYGGEAMYRTALIQQRHLDQAERARQTRRETIFSYPKSVSAEFAVRDLADYYERRGALDEIKADFEDIYARVAGTPIGDNIMFELGRVLERSGGRDDEALGAYREVVREYNDDSLADDALWQMSKIYRRHQMWEPAMEALELCAAKMEPSWFIGDYNSPWANDARFQLGIINLLFLDRYDVAIDQFEQYLDDFPTSLFADDAAWHILEARRLLGERTAYREAMRQFIDEYPESRHVRTAKTRLGISEDDTP
ncbi:MAG: tetratricopeptide repeat protein [Myxococcota bacterium]